MNNVYIYDGTFDSLLALIITLIPLKLKNINIKSEQEFEETLFDEPVYLNIENKKSKLQYIYKNINSYLIHIMYYVYLTSEKSKENVIYYFLLNTLKYKNNILDYRNLNCVNTALRLSKYVSSEAHKLKGFLRFKMMRNNFYYAEVNPTNNVILILANHFKKRMKNEYFLIRDTNRNIYAMYDLEKITILNKEDIKSLNIELEENELLVEDLWKTFFKTIAIKERENKRCQMNFMPKKYWENMIEMEIEYEKSC